jgi:hypothetical protein
VAKEEEAGVEAATEETGSSGIDGDGGDQRSRELQSRERQRLREFEDESETIQDELLFICSKISAVTLN